MIMENTNDKKEKGEKTMTGKYLNPKADLTFKMAVLWLRFLTEISEKTEVAPAELLENEQTRKALSIVEKSAFTEGQLYAYEQFWDAVVNERVLRQKFYREGRAKGLAEGERKNSLETARKMKEDHVPADVIAKHTGLSTVEIEAL